MIYGGLIFVFFIVIILDCLNDIYYYKKEDVYWNSHREEIK